MIDFFQMPEETLASFEVRRLQVLDEKGEADEALMPGISGEEIKKGYELIILSRVFDERALSLQREGRIGTYASVLGQEASQVGSALAVKKLLKNPWVFPSFREMCVYIALGYPPYMLYQYWSGDERGISPPEGLNIFPLCVPVGTQIPYAVGAAVAVKYKKENTAVITYFGDGGTSKGDFHEGLNMAGVFKLPVVFICQNNQWAISVPIAKQTASMSIAQKAVSYGFPGVQVDGNDLLAVYKATEEAIERALKGEGPTLIECFTYRLSDHTTADDAKRYRTGEEVERWKEKDPVKRLRAFMEKKGLWSPEFEEGAMKKAASAVDEAVKQEESVTPASPRDIFKYTYHSLTRRQKKQLEEAGWQ